MSNATAMHNYTDALEIVPEEALLGSLLYFTISEADVNLDLARQELANAGLSTDTLRKNLRPVDAFRKSTREIAHKFKPVNGIRSEIMVRPVGEDGERVHRHLILERASFQAGKKRRISYEKVGEIIFTRGTKKDGEYTGHSVESRRTTDHLASPLTTEEDEWLTARLADFEDRYDHLLNYMDSHAVRTFVREYIYDLYGICVKESGGLYFVAQNNVPEINKLATWVESIGSQFHSLPLLNLVDQRDMILNAFEDEAVKEVDRLMGEITKILSDPARTIEAKTFDAYGLRAAELAAKVNDYNGRLGTKADRAQHSVGIFSQQILQLASRIKDTKSTATPVTVAP